jgi:hypothetical protein
MIDAIRVPPMMHELFVIGGTAFYRTIHAEGLCPFLILAIELLDHIRSQTKRCISLFGVRESAYEIDQSRRKLRHCLQWIGEAEQGF